MRNGVLTVVLLSLNLLITACAKPLTGSPMNTEAYDAAVVRARLIGKERQEFDVSHNIKGQIADTVLRQLQSERYACRLGYLDLVRIAEDGITMQPVRTPLVFCTQRSFKPRDVCAERHVNLSIAWQRPEATEPELQAQLAFSLISARTFRCVGASEAQ